MAGKKPDGHVGVRVVKSVDMEVSCPYWKNEDGSKFVRYPDMAVLVDGEEVKYTPVTENKRTII